MKGTRRPLLEESITSPSCLRYQLDRPVRGLVTGRDESFLFHDLHFEVKNHLFLFHGATSTFGLYSPDKAFIHPRPGLRNVSSKYLCRNVVRVRFI